MDDLIERLRALSRHEHSDMTIGDEAADALEAAREDVASWNAQAMHNLDLIERLADALRDIESVTLYSGGYAHDVARAALRQQDSWRGGDG